MSNDSLLQRLPRVIFFGMQGAFSSPSLVALLKGGVEVCAVVVPGAAPPGSTPPAIQRKEAPRTAHTALPIFTHTMHRSIIDIAFEKRIPVWEMHKPGDKETITTLATYQADMICVACFSLLIPRAILQLPRLGCLNVHPSLLPQNRGPEPLFWTFREGHDETGVTIHLMDERMDSGAILAQAAISVPDGITYNQLEGLCASSGGELLAQAVRALYQGQFIASAQDDAKSSYHSFPIASDFVVNVEEWSARHVYNFIKGVGHWDGPVELQTERGNLLVYDAFSYSLEGHSGQSEGHEGIRCRDGWVYLQLYPKGPE
jgi:methionyl-tRNA formyltransferase